MQLVHRGLSQGTFKRPQNDPEKAIIRTGIVLVLSHRIKKI
jgi:hypothetical protein